MVPVVCCWFFDFVAPFYFLNWESEEYCASFPTRNEAIVLLAAVLLPEVQLASPGWGLGQVLV